MRIITEPKVTLIASTQFHGHPVYQIPEDGTDFERLGAFASKGCYDSYLPKGRDNLSNQRRIIAEKHGCYDAETEVLTADGWKRWEKVTLDDLLATRTEDGYLEYHKPVRLIRYHHRGLMYRVEARGVDLLVTPNHKMLVCPTTTKAGRTKERFTLVRADELDTRSHAYVKSAEWEHAGEGMDLNVLRLLGFTIGDGGMASVGHIRFNLRRERKIQWLNTVLSTLGWNRTDGGGVTVPREWQEIFSQLYTEDREKQIPQHMFTSLSKRELLALFEGLMESDGHRGRTGDSFDTTSTRLVGQVQQLALHIGRAANVCYVREDRAGSYGEKPLTRLSILRRELTPEVNKHAGSVGRTRWVDEWEGEVFCAEVPNHTLYVRRNGIPVWSGNSVLEHSYATVFVEGITRGVSLEINRHRHLGISQRSSRYVAEEDGAIVLVPFYARLWEKHRASLTPSGWVAFVVPEYESAEAEEQAREERYILRNHVQAAFEANRAYAVEVSMLTRLNPEGLSGFGLRKWARGNARNLLPHNTETRATYTLNMRAFRHFLEMRSSEHAEDEVRLIANKMLDVLRPLAPTYFEDYQPREVRGILEWTTEHRKV